MFRYTSIILVLMVATCLKSNEPQDSLLQYMIQPAQVESLPLDGNRNTRDLLHLKGRVKRMDSRFYSAKVKKGQVISVPLTVGAVIYQDSRYEFLPNGMANEFVMPARDWKSVRYKIGYYYDSLNRLINTIGISNINFLPINFQRYHYNEDGQMVCIENKNGITRLNKLVYSDSAQVITVLGLVEGGYQSKAVYTVDRLGNTTSFKQFLDHPDSMFYELIYERDSMGVLQSETIIDRSSPHESKIVYHYDSLGNLIACEDYYGVTLRGKERYEYTFDQHGNWTRRIIFVNHVPWVVEERTFEYF